MKPPVVSSISHRRRFIIFRRFNLILAIVAPQRRAVYPTFAVEAANLAVSHT
jgi:hypothetical protein